MAPGLCVRHRKAFMTLMLFLESKKNYLGFFLGTLKEKAFKPLIHKEFILA